MISIRRKIGWPWSGGADLAGMAEESLGVDALVLYRTVSSESAPRPP